MVVRLGVRREGRVRGKVMVLVVYNMGVRFRRGSGSVQGQGQEQRFQRSVLNKIAQNVTLTSTLTLILSQTLTLALILNLDPTPKPKLATVSDMIDTF